MEYCELTRHPEGWSLRGQVVLAEEAAPAYFAYVIACDPAWVTRSAPVEARRGGASQSLSLEADDRRRWFADGREVVGVRGCVDVDLGFTPATNTIALRRLALGVAGTAEVRAAWVRPDDLALLPLAQQYTREAATTYDYRSQSGFATRIEVDEVGLVISYPPLWRRVSPTG